MHARLHACGRGDGGAEGWDPVLPSGRKVLRDAELERKLTAAGATAAGATEKCGRLGQAAQRAASSMANFSGRSSKRVRVSEFEAGQSGRKVRLAVGNHKTEVNAAHYEKLQILYGQHAREGAPDFPTAAFCLLMRYNASAGANYRGGGFQAAIPEKLFLVLRKHFGVSLECFASPLNCHCECPEGRRRGGGGAAATDEVTNCGTDPRFCSAYFDTDRHFGSLGTFFRFRPRAGSYEANPPFDPGLVLDMARRMDGLLAAATQALSFVVIIPHWPDKDCWRALRDSAFCRHHLKVAKFSHRYFEGSQHNRSNRYRTANFDTSCFFLQNAAGAERWAVTPKKLKKVARAFGDGSSGEEGPEAGAKRREARPTDGAARRPAKAARRAGRAGRGAAAGAGGLGDASS